MKGKYVVLTKVEDLKFGGAHPNGINVGNNNIQGICSEEPKEGEQLFLQSGFGYSTCWTSKVKSYDEETKTLITENSIYKVDIHEE